MKYDIVVIGAGIVGLTFASMLKNLGLKLALIDKSPLNTWNPKKIDHRVSAINLQSQSLFKTLDIWPNIESQRISPFQDMYVWDSTGRGSIEFHSKEVGKPYLGHIIENSLIQHTLQEQLQSYENIDFFYETSISSFNIDDNKVIISLPCQKKIESRLLVGADGARSWVREQANIPITEKQYNHHAIVATIQTEKPHEQTARQIFLPTGPLAFLPLKNEYQCSIVWSVIPDKSKYLMSLDKKTFQKELAFAFQHQLGQVELLSERFSFPLIMRHANCYVKPRLALIGDAAHTIHPLAGLGMNLGILDASTLANKITHANHRSRNFESLMHLRKYERARKSHNQQMILIMNAFKKLFETSSLQTLIARNIGLRMTNHLPILKNKIMEYAMGFQTQ